MEYDILKSEFLMSLINLRNSVTSDSPKGLIVTIDDDGYNRSNKEYIVNKLLAIIPPDQVKLVKPSKAFMIKDFWANQPAKGKITIFDTSYIPEIGKSRELTDEATFFKYMMLMDNTEILHIWSGIFMQSLPVDVNITTSTDKYEEIDRIMILIKDEITSMLSKKDLIKHNVSECIFNDGDVNQLSKIRNKLHYVNMQDYEYRKDEFQRIIKKYHKELIEQGKSVAIVFQGIDAAGKSSTIRRLLMPLIPGYYEVIPSKAPSKEELSRSYLWRYWNKISKPGMVYIFDRSWYERIIAERFLDLNKSGWKTAPREIEEFERELEANNIKVIKFFFNIDKQTQAERFDERKNNPLKRYKFSEADEETRKNWDGYANIFASLLATTSGWFLIDSRDKVEARLNVLFIIAEEMRKFLGKGE